MKYDFYFKDNKTEINRLSKLKLKLTKEQEEMILSHKYSRFISIIQLWNNKILERTFAIRNRNGKTQYQEVKRAIEGNKNILIKNINYIAMGNYIVCWSKKEAIKKCYYFNKYDFDLWQIDDISRYSFNNAYRNYTINDLINLDSSLKYCSYDETMSAIMYVSMYRKQPKVEMLSKIGLTHLMNNSAIMNKLEDKKFCKWLYKQSIDIRNYRLELLTGLDFIYAYNHNCLPQDVREHRLKCNELKIVKKELPDIDIEKTYRYLKKNSIDTYSYCDLIIALKYFKLDLNDTKNIYPKDFKYWHDYYTKQMRADKNKELDLKIENQCKKYQKILIDFSSKLKLIFPHCTEDFINEGAMLNHCVGRMNYNKKMADDETLIIFVRKKENVNVPYYTLEYNPHNQRILQFYGENDSLPINDVKEEIYSKWLPKIKKIRI